MFEILAHLRCRYSNTVDLLPSSYYSFKFDLAYQRHDRNFRTPNNIHCGYLVLEKMGCLWICHSKFHFTYYCLLQYWHLITDINQSYSNLEPFTCTLFVSETKMAVLRIKFKSKLYSNTLLARRTRSPSTLLQLNGSDVPHSLPHTQLNLPAHHGLHPRP